MSIAAIIAAEVLTCSMIVNVTFETPDRPDYGVWDWLSGVNSRKKAYITVGGNRYRLRYLDVTVRGNFQPALASWTAATKTLTSVGAFANYRAPFDSLDHVVLTDNYSGSSSNPNFAIASRVSDDAITLVNSISGSDIAVVSLLEMDPRQCTKLRITAQFQIVDDDGNPYRVTPGASVTLDMDAMALVDFQGNTHSAVTNYAVTNNAVIGSAGFIDTTHFTSGDVLYVAPGHASASDARAFAAAVNNMSTPYATLNGAEAAAHTAGKNGTRLSILILEGTDHTLTAGVHLRCGGAGLLSPHVIGRYWDAGAGVGTAGVRPIVRTTASFNIFSQGGGGSPTTVQYIYFTGLKFDSGGANACFNFLNMSNMVMDDIIMQNSSGGNVNFSISSSPIPLLTGILFNRFTQCDGGSNAAHTNIFVQGVADLQVIECISDFVGRKNTDLSGVDQFSRAWYFSRSVLMTSVVGNWISRCDAIQLRGSGCIYANALENCAMFNFVGMSGAVRFNVSRGGGNITTQAQFTGATYTHSTRTLSLAGIGTGFTSGSVVAMSGTGLPADKVKREIRVSSVSTNALVLAGDGMGADATSVAGTKLNGGRGFGPVTSSPADTILWEQNLCDALSDIGTQPFAFTVDGKGYNAVPSVGLTYRAGSDIVSRNNTGYRSGADYMTMSDTTVHARVRKHRNIIDTRGQWGTPRCLSSLYSLSSWAPVVSDDNLYLSDTPSTLANIISTPQSLATWRTNTGSDANSSDDATGLSYIDETASFNTWFASFGTTLDAWYTYLRGRAPGVWPEYANMYRACGFMLGQKMLQGKGDPVSAPGAALNFYGASKGLDPAVFAGLESSATIEGAYEPSVAVDGAAGGDRWDAFWSAPDYIFTNDELKAYTLYDNVSGAVPNPDQESTSLYVRGFNVPSMAGRRITSIRVRARIMLEASAGSMTFYLRMRFASGTTDLATFVNPVADTQDFAGVAGSKYTTLTDVDVTVTDAATLAAIRPYIDDADFGVRVSAICEPGSGSGTFQGGVYIDSLRIMEIQSVAETAGGTYRDRDYRARSIVR